jgi:hypothetical protein
MLDNIDFIVLPSKLVLLQSVMFKNLRIQDYIIEWKPVSIPFALNIA